MMLSRISARLTHLGVESFLPLLRFFFFLSVRQTEFARMIEENSREFARDTTRRTKAFGWTPRERARYTHDKVSSLSERAGTGQTSCKRARITRDSPVGHDIPLGARGHQLELGAFHVLGEVRLVAGLYDVHLHVGHEVKNSQLIPIADQYKYLKNDLSKGGSG